MNKLLSANFFRLRKNKCFRGSLAFMFVIGIASPLLRYRDMKQSGYINNLDNGFFMCALFIGIILAVFCSLFIGTEHNDGTIRNKIIVGQKRETIYLSNMVTCSIIAITMCIVFFVPYLSVGIPLLGFFVADMKMIVMIGITVLVLSVTFASLFYIVKEENHYCTGEDCPICANIHQAEQTLRNVGNGTITIATINPMLILFVLLITGQFLIVSDTSLVSQKVRLND